MVTAIDLPLLPRRLLTLLGQVMLGATFDIERHKLRSSIEVFTIVLHSLVYFFSE